MSFLRKCLCNCSFFRLSVEWHKFRWNATFKSIVVLLAHIPPTHEIIYCLQYVCQISSCQKPPMFVGCSRLSLFRSYFVLRILFVPLFEKLFSGIVQWLYKANERSVNVWVIFQNSSNNIIIIIIKCTISIEKTDFLRRIFEFRKKQMYQSDTSYVKRKC